MVATLTDSDCHSMSQLAGTTSMKGGALEMITPGSCAASGGEVYDEYLRSGGAVDNANGAFGNQVDLCRYSGPATCEGGVCSYATPDSRQHTCILHEGDVVCPAGWGAIAAKPTVYDRDGYKDTRACTACTCEPTAETCDESIHYELFTNDACGSVPALSVGDTCYSTTNVTSAANWSIKLTAGPLGTSTCKKAGGVVSGAVSPGNPLTLCCL